MIRRRIVAAATIVLSAAAGWAGGIPEEAYRSLKWREVGPYRGGRVAAVAGVPGRPRTFFAGAAGGGVWRTTDAGASWENVSDGFFGGSIGAVAVAPSDPNVVYVGGGEVTVRGNVSHGDGVWRSTDGGETWTHVGLPDSRHVTRIVVHPADPDLVYAAVLGHLWGPNPERGVYRSRDGGATWERVLFVSEDAGAVDLAMDPANPRVLYASTWRVRRRPWELVSGGEGSALWKSTDGGSTWEELSDNPGFPEPPLGIIGVSISPADHRTVYAIAEARDGGVFRSTDAGATWERVNGERKLRQRAWYYSRIVADPRDRDTVWVLNVRLWRSRDGGRSFEAVPTPHGDNHDLWIDPADSDRMVEGNDGGACVSLDGGRTWSPLDNQPTAQIYRVSTDTAFPYRILGAQQDNTALRIASRSDGRGIGPRDWEPTAGGESGYIVADPEDPEVVYGGSYGGLLVRLDHRTREIRNISVWPDDPMGWGARELRYRFQWNFPVFFSPHDPDVLYAAANVLFRSTDEGASWEAISPDLTRNDPSKQGPSGGPITKDNTGVEYYDTIFAAAESPVRAGVLWAGSDDGLVHLSTDGGATWKDVTPRGMPEWIRINAIEPSPFDPAACYLAATMYQWDDLDPYLYATTDWGRTWRRMDAGIPRGEFTRVVRADPAREGLLFAGTERGVWVSLDDGRTWSSLQLNLPVVPVTDLAVKDGDLIAATQGRGFWVLDDLTPLERMPAAGLDAAPHLFPPRPAYRLRGRPRGDRRGAGENPPAGAVVDYLLPDLPEGTEVRLDILGPEGAVLCSFTGKVGEEKPGGGGAEEGERPDEAGWRPPEPQRLPVTPGHDRFVWDLRLPDPEGFEGMVLWGGLPRGPLVAPGSYTLRLAVGDAVREAPLEVRADPRSRATREGLEAQLATLMELRDAITEAHRAVRRIREARSGIEALLGRLGEGHAEVRGAAEALRDRLTRIEEALYQTENRSPQDPLNFPIRLDNKLASLYRAVATGDNPPTRQQLEVKEELLGRLHEELAALHRALAEDLPALNRLAAEAGVPAVAEGERGGPGGP